MVMFTSEPVSLLISGRVQLNSVGVFLWVLKWTLNDSGRKEIYLEDIGWFTGSPERLENQNPKGLGAGHAALCEVYSAAGTAPLGNWISVGSSSAINVVEPPASLGLPWWLRG